MIGSQDVIAAEAKYIVQSYVRPEVVFSHGQGVYLYDTTGRRYLDFAAGIAVNALGHSDPAWVHAVTEQAARLTHVSNLYHTQPQVELARRLVENSFADRVFFNNSGSEANETALKFARKVASTHFSPEKSQIVAFERGFHGRTMGALSVTHKVKYRKPFVPLVPGVTFVPYNDLVAAQEAINHQTCAVIIEPIQGEGGIHAAEPAFLAGLRTWCDQHNALLIFDEVQCGLGRTGHLWAHLASGVLPDIMTLAKPLAGGLPIGVALMTEAVAEVIQPGDHGSTFAGGPLVCHAAVVVFDRINQPVLLESVRAKGTYLQERLCQLESQHVAAVRGAGLLVGVELNIPAAPIIASAREQGLILINSGENVLRLCPPLIVEQAHIDQAVMTIRECLNAA
jgi:predicted acetylornithine/succinylornithine family transaminase